MPRVGARAPASILLASGDQDAMDRTRCPRSAHPVTTSTWTFAVAPALRTLTTTASAHWLAPLQRDYRLRERFPTSVDTREGEHRKGRGRSRPEKWCSDHRVIRPDPLPRATPGGRLPCRGERGGTSPVGPC